METEVALITACCVLFVQMGLSDAIQDVLHFRFRILSCPKCLTFWSCLAWLALHRRGVVVSVSASFLASYCAMWVALLYDSLAILYNYLYEQITQTDGTSEDAADPGTGQGPQSATDEVPQM